MIGAIFRNILILFASSISFSIIFILLTLIILPSIKESFFVNVPSSLESSLRVALEESNKTLWPWQRGIPNNGENSNYRKTMLNVLLIEFSKFGGLLDEFIFKATSSLGFIIGILAGILYIIHISI